MVPTYITVLLVLGSLLSTSTVAQQFGTVGAASSGTCGGSGLPEGTCVSWTTLCGKIEEGFCDGGFKCCKPDLVGRLSNYPGFLPLCQGTCISGICPNSAGPGYPG